MMKRTTKEKTEKKLYKPPMIERILIDTDVSLILQSGTEPEPEPSWTMNTEYINSSPYNLT